MKFLLTFLLLIPFALSAQTLPVDLASGKIYFTEEVPAKDAPVTDLYNRANRWLNIPEKNKKNLEDIIQNPVINEKKYLFLLIDDAGLQHEVNLKYTVRIEMEDDRFWYRFSEFEAADYKIGKRNNKKHALETILLSKANSEKERQFQLKLKEVFIQEMAVQISSLKAAMY